MSRHVQYRRVKCQGRRTFAGLEPEFWDAIDFIASAENITPQQWCEAQLMALPKGRSMTSWLRVAALDGAMAL